MRLAVFYTAFFLFLFLFCFVLSVSYIVLDSVSGYSVHLRPYYPTKVTICAPAVEHDQLGRWGEKHTAMMRQQMLT